MIESRKKATLANLLSSYANTAFLMITGFLLLPIYFKYITLESYGAWLASGNLIGLFGILQGGIQIVFAQKASYCYGKNNIEDFLNIIGSGLVIALFLALTTAIGIYFFAPVLISSLNINTNDINILIVSARYAGYSAALNILISYIIYIFGSWQKNVITSILSFTGNIIGVLFTFFAIVLWNQGILSLALGLLARAIFLFISLVLALVYEWHKRGLPIATFRKECIKDILSESIPLMFANITGIIINNSKDFLTAWFINPEATALLSITNKLYGLIISLLNPIGSSLFQSLCSLKSETDKFKKLVSSINELQIIVSFIIFPLAIFYNYYFVSIWVGADKYGGFTLSFLLGFSGFIMTRGTFIVNILYANGSFKKVSYLTIFDLLTRLLLILVIFSFLKIKSLLLFPIIEISAMFVPVLYLNSILSQITDIDTIDTSRNKNLNYKFLSFNFSMAMGLIMLIFLLVSYFIQNSFFETSLLAFSYLLTMVFVLFYFKKSFIFINYSNLRKVKN